MTKNSNWNKKLAARRRGELIGEFIAYALLAFMAAVVLLILGFIIKWLYQSLFGV